MTMIPTVVPPFPTKNRWHRSLAPADALQWLAAGWRDSDHPANDEPRYGLLIFLISLAIVGGLFRSGWDYILFPAFAGFMVVGPILAVGLYEKSRRIAAGQPVELRRHDFRQAAIAADRSCSRACCCAC